MKHNESNASFLPLPLVEECHRYGAKIGLQISHAGRKSKIAGADIVAPSAIPFSADSPMPRELSKRDIEQLVIKFGVSAELAVKAGFDCIEIHAANGYLLHQFMSPLSNKRTDEYGVPTKFPLEVIREVKSKMPAGMPLICRVCSRKAGDISCFSLKLCGGVEEQIRCNCHVRRRIGRS